MKFVAHERFQYVLLKKFGKKRIHTFILLEFIKYVYKEEQEKEDV